MRTALIIGASGMVGRVCLYQLLENPAYSRVVALVRKPLALKHHQLHQLVVDFDNLDAYLSEIRGDDVFCCLGTTMKTAGSREAFKKVDYTYPLTIGKQALINGASQYLIISSIGADVNAPFFYNRVKGEVEREVQQLGYPSVHIFRPSLLLGNRTQLRIGELLGKAVLKPLSVLFVGPLKKFRGIEAKTLAKAMLRVALEHKTGNHIYPNNMLFDLGV